MTNDEHEQEDAKVCVKCVGGSPWAALSQATKPEMGTTRDSAKT